MAEEEKGFVIKDKRTFSQETGEPTEETIQEATKQKEAESAEKKSPETDFGTEEEEQTQLPEVNFSTFIFSLSSSALLHFGEIPDPSSGSKKKNLAMAKHTIDILSMLEKKTTGNLTRDEEQLFKNILYDLKMRYVKEVQ